MTDKEKQEIADLVIKKMLQARSNMEKDLFNINDILFTLLNTYSENFSIPTPFSKILN